MTACEPGLDGQQALDTVPDAVRFTLTYGSDRYAEGVRSDVDRIKSEGFELIKLKNLWAEEQYKGINSQWRQAGNGAALRGAVPHAGEPRGKELTHKAYERLRSPASPPSARNLRTYQRRVNARLGTPPEPPRSKTSRRNDDDR